MHRFLSCHKKHTVNHIGQRRLTDRTFKNTVCEEFIVVRKMYSFVDLIFICRRHGFSDELLLRLLAWYCRLHQQHACEHCRLAIHMCTARRRGRLYRSINENRRTALSIFRG